MKFYLCFKITNSLCLSLHFTCTLCILLIQHIVYIKSSHFRFYVADHASAGIGRLVTSNILSPTTAKLVASDPFYVGFNPYPTVFPYGNGMVLHFYQQQESSTTKTVHKVINKRLKTYV